MFRNLPEVTQLTSGRTRVRAVFHPCRNRCPWFLVECVPLCSGASRSFILGVWSEGQPSGCFHACWSAPQLGRHGGAQTATPPAREVTAEGGQRLGSPPYEVSWGRQSVLP